MERYIKAKCAVCRECVYDTLVKRCISGGPYIGYRICGTGKLLTLDEIERK